MHSWVLVSCEYQSITYVIAPLPFGWPVEAWLTRVSGIEQTADRSMQLRAGLTHWFGSTASSTESEWSRGIIHQSDLEAMIMILQGSNRVSARFSHGDALSRNEFVIAGLCGNFSDVAGIKAELRSVRCEEDLNRLLVLFTIVPASPCQGRPRSLPMPATSRTESSLRKLCSGALTSYFP